MAWIDIPDSDLDTDSPIDVELVTALRDNTLAIAAASSGAPQYQSAAFGDNCVTNDNFVDGTIQPIKWSWY